MKTLRPLVIMLFTAMVYGPTQAATEMTMTSPDGDSLTISEVKISDADVKKSLKRLGVVVDSNHSLCQVESTGESRNFRQVETKMELEVLIASLKEKDKGKGYPRQLRELQMRSLKRIPGCKTFLKDLYVISKLTRGWDISENP